MGLFFAGLLLITNPQTLSNSELERRARDIGMVYKDEVFAFESAEQEEPTKPTKLTEPAKPTKLLEQQSAVLTVNVASGSSLEDVGEQLKAVGVIEDKEAFLKEVRQQKASGKIIAGNYELTADMEIKEVVRLLTEKYRP